MTNQERFPGAYIGQGAYIEQGAYIGQGARIGQGAHIGQGALIRKGDEYVTVLGYADDYWKTLTRRNGVLWINAGCRDFSLDDALKHWRKAPNRELTYALVKAAAKKHGAA